MQLQRFGLNDWLVSDIDVPALCQTLSRANLPSDLVEWVPGFDTLLFRYRCVVDEEAVRHLLQSLLAEKSPDFKPELHSLPVVYDGPDLPAASEALNLSTAEIIRRHSAPLYTVRLLGFAPGFGYLDGLPPELHLPRRDTPRPRIGAGTVAIGGSHTGIYSVASPGGWNCIGRTEAALFTPENQNHPFLLHPGDQVQFIPVN